MAAKLVRNTLLAVAIGLGTLTVAPSTTAHATTLAPLTVDQLTDASDFIVRGTVTEVWTEVDDRGRIWTRARVDVSETLKGPDSPDELIVDSLGGTYGSQSMHIEARAEFSVHEELLAFVSLNEHGRYVPIGKFLGKYSIRRAPDTDRQYARTWHPKAGLKFDARFLPHPAEEHRIYLDTLLEQIQTRLDAGWDGKPIPGLSLDKLQEINTLDRRMR